MNKLIPMGNKVLVLPIKPKEQTEGGLYVPVQVQSKATNEAEVIAIGPDCKLVQPGMVVIIGLLAGREINYSNTSYRIVSEQDIDCLVQGM